MTVVTGTVSATKVDGPIEGQYGQFYRIGIKLDNEQWYNKNANTAENLPAKGSEVTIIYDTKVLGGREYNNITKDGLQVTGSSSFTTSKAVVKKTATATPATSFVSDNRQESITFQNALAHATNLLIYNNSLTKKSVELSQVLNLARELQLVSLNPTEYFNTKSKPKAKKTAEIEVDPFEETS